MKRENMILQCPKRYGPLPTDTLYPSTIPNHFFLISTLIKSLKKICQKMLKIESGNKFLKSIKGNDS